MNNHQIIIKMRGIAAGISHETTFVHRLKTNSGAPLTMITPEVIAAARTCPSAAMQVHLERAARDLQIYQTAITIAHQIARQITEVEDLAAAEGSPQ